MLLIPTFLCPKPWEGMAGDERQRFCTYCKKHVHNLEALTVEERLRLLSSPAASICSRYEVAIRRPAPGKEALHHHHLLLRSAGALVAGSVLMVLWEMQRPEEKGKVFRAVATSVATLSGMDADDLMLPEYYTERHAVFWGMSISMPTVPSPPGFATPNPSPPDYVDVRLDPVEIGRLIEQSEPDVPDLKPIVPRNGL